MNLLIKWQIISISIFNTQLNWTAVQKIITKMSQPQGLIYCIRDWSDTFCITKAIQFLVSFGIFMFLIHGFVIRFCKERQFNFFFIVYLQMMAALLANCIFNLDHRIRPMMYIQDYAYNIYFTTIVYQVSQKLVQLKRASQHFRRIWISLHGLLIFFILFLTVTFIIRNVITYYECEQAWLLIVNMLGISLSVLMVIAGRFYTKVQSQKIQGIVQKNTKNPLPEVWKWIIINITCQFFIFLRNFIYIVSPHGCQFSGSYDANQILDLFFDVFSFHVGMVATVFFFKKKSEQDDLSNKNFQSTIRDRLETSHSKQIQMQQTAQKVNKNSTNPKQRQQLQLQRYRMTAKMYLNADGNQSARSTQKNMPNFSI